MCERETTFPFKGATVSFTPILADYIYISGGVIGAILLILLVLWLLRRT